PAHDPTHVLLQPNPQGPGDGLAEDGPSRDAAASAGWALRLRHQHIEQILAWDGWVAWLRKAHMPAPSGRQPSARGPPLAAADDAGQGSLTLEGVRGRPRGQFDCEARTLRPQPTPLPDTR